MQEKNNKSFIIGGVVLVAIVLGIGFYVFNKESGYKFFAPDSSVSQSTTTVNIGGIEVGIPAGGGVTVEQIPIDPEKEFGLAPTLNRAINFPTSFSEDARAIFTDKINATRQALKTEPYSYNNWISIGQLYDMVRDYEGVRQAWEYAAKINPRRSTAFGNLGFLYGYNLHDNVKAELNFKTALKIDPKALYLYQQTFEFYRDVLKDVSKARALAEEGKVAAGNNMFFDQLLSTLK